MMLSSFHDRRVYFFVLSLFLIFGFSLITPPRNFPVGQIVEIPEGSGLQNISEILKEENLIRSPFWFRTFAIVLGGERGMKAGQYYFSHPQSSALIAWRITRGKHQIETLKLTIPEGFTVSKISKLFDEKFSYFDNELFEKTAKEGYLFPDTYFIPVTATASSTIKIMTENFNDKLEPLAEEIKSSGKTLSQIITMASIVEAEANTKEGREIVSGILWKRLSLGIALQVDASFIYVNGKGTKDLTASDLKIDSPYNTYLYRGLPPTPISNPGLESILATLYPTSTPYLYFLTGDDGKMYYAKTFDEHVSNKNKYLK